MIYYSKIVSATIITFIAATNLLATTGDFEELLSEATEIATKNKINIDYTPGIISVITGEELMKMGISHFDSSALNMIPGFSRNYSRKSGDFTKYLYTLNGMPINTQLTGIGVLPLLSSKEILRIEIIRGPSSALYGANAFSALINIITKKDENIVWTDYTHFSNSNRGISIGAVVQHKVDDLAFSLHAHKLTSDGLDQRVTQDTASLFGLSSYTPAKVNLGQKYYDLGFSLEYKNWKINYERLSSGYSSGYGISRSFLPPNTNDTKQRETKDILEITNNVNVKDWHFTTKIGYLNFNQEIIDTYVAPAGVPFSPSVTLATDYIIDGQFKERNLYAEFEAKRSFNEHEILIGARYFYAHLYQTNYSATQNFITNEVYAQPTLIDGVMPKKTRRTQSLWLQDYFTMYNNFIVVANLRYDYISDIDEDVITPRLAFIYEANDNNIIKAQYTKAFLTPLFYSLYADGTKGFISGNPNLSIDQSDNYEISHIYKQFGNSIKTTFYYTDMYDIGTIYQNGHSVIDATNSIQSSGVEVELNQGFDYFDLQANLSYNFYSHVKYVNARKYDDEVRILPGVLGNIIISGDITSRLSSTLWYNYVGEKKQYFSNAKRHEEHLINFNVTYQTSLSDNRLSLTLSANDLLDQNEADVSFDNTFKNGEYIYKNRHFLMQLNYTF